MAASNLGTWSEWTRYKLTGDVDTAYDLVNTEINKARVRGMPRELVNLYVRDSVDAQIRRDIGALEELYVELTKDEPGSAFANADQTLGQAVKEEGKVVVTDAIAGAAGGAEEGALFVLKAAWKAIPIQYKLIGGVVLAGVALVTIVPGALRTAVLVKELRRP